MDKLNFLNRSDEDRIRRFNNLKRQNGNLKTMVAIGGANGDSAAFSQVVGDNRLRSVFADNVIAFLKKYSFDGFDLDWEYPTDKMAFTELLKVLRPKFDANRFLLSAAVAASRDRIDASYDVPSLGSWDPVTGENGALFAGPADKSDYWRTLNADSIIKYYIEKGAPKGKIVLGIGTYGQTFTLSNPSNNEVGAPASGAGKAGPYTQKEGYLGYNEMCEAGGWTRKWSDAQKVPYAFKGNQWIGYDDVDSVKEKANYVRNNGLCGVMFWALGTDDFKNSCGGGKFPLINAAKSVLA